MIVRGELLIRGEHRTAAAYDTAGYLKWFHFVTLHAVLVLAGLSWLLARTERTPQAQHRIVAIATGGYVVAATVVLAICLARA
jgi:multisubunit Na+/H+ antiporter MnhF subunit